MRMRKLKVKGCWGNTPIWGSTLLFTIGSNITLSLIQHGVINNIKNIKLNAEIMTANCQYKTVILVIVGRI